mgnify:CR=1 FL=1
MTLQEQLELLRKWEEQSSAISRQPIVEMEQEPSSPNLNFKIDSTEKAIEEGIYFAQGKGDHPNMRTSDQQKRVMPTPDEAEEQGLVGQGIEAISDFTLGMATGFGYGVDELAVSASKVLNALIPDSIMGDSDEYTGRYISKYMDMVSKRTNLKGEPAGAAGRAIGQFLTGWHPALKAVKLLSRAKTLGSVGQKISKGMPANFLASSLAGATAYSPNYENLANDLSVVDNHLAGAVSRALATNPNDPEWKNRLRNALVEGGLAGFGDVAVKTLAPVARGVGGLTKQAVKPVSEWFIDTLDLHKQSLAFKTATKNGLVGTKDLAGHKGTKVLQLGKDDVMRAVDDVPQIAKEAVDKATGKPKPTGTLIFTLKGNQTVKEAIGDGVGIQENMVKLETVGDKMKYANSLMDTITKKTKKSSSKAEWAEKGMGLAMRAGFDVDVLRHLHDKGLVAPEIIYGFGHVAESVARKLEVATENSKMFMKKLNPTKEEAIEVEANFLRALADGMEIQQMFKSAGSKAGESLRAYKIAVDDFGKGFDKRIFDNSDNEAVLEFFKHSRLGGMELSRIANMLSTAYTETGRVGMQKTIRDGFKSGTMDMFIEAWINQGLLSNPGTHMMNLIIGKANLISYPISQFTAATISKVPFANKLLGTETVTYREAFGSMYGMLAGLHKAFQLSLKAGATGKSSWGQGSKIDNYGMQHIAASSVDMEGTAIGLGLDYMGSLTRAPGRFLLMEDEFVKTVAGEMKKHSLAWRYAYANTSVGTSIYRKFTGTFSDKIEGLYKEIVDNPQIYKERIGNVDYSFKSQIDELADLVTFQKKTGKIANYLTQAGIQYPILKLGMPFVKVLSNIPKFTVQHSPLGLAFQNQEFKRGGSARMLELGRMSYGTLMMWYGANMYQNGQLTGSGPREYWKAIGSQQSGVEPPRSLKVKPVNAKSNQAYWIDISRFSPYSNLLMMGADISEAMEARKELEPTELIMKGITSLQKNLVDPTWAPSLHKVLGLSADSSSEPGDWTRALKSISGTLQPAFSRAYEKTRSPGKAELKAYGLNPESIKDFRPADWSGYMAQILATSPVHSDLVPTTRNFLGDQVKYEKGIGSGLPGILHNPVWSFVTIRKADETPALVHLFKDLEFEIPRPANYISAGNNVNVRLTPHEYEEYVKRIGKMKDAEGNNMKQAIETMFKNPVYKNVYNNWKNTDNLQEKAHQEDKMLGIMTSLYNSRKNRAKQSMISDFNLSERAMELYNQFGGDYGRIQ